MAYLGRLGPKRVPFSGFRYIEVVGISQVEVYETVRKWEYLESHHKMN